MNLDDLRECDGAVGLGGRRGIDDSFERLVVAVVVGIAVVEVLRYSKTCGLRTYIMELGLVSSILYEADGAGKLRTLAYKASGDNDSIVGESGAEERRLGVEPVELGGNVEESLPAECGGEELGQRAVAEAV